MSKLHEIQHDPAEIKRAEALKPFEFYNKYIRKEGQRVVTEEEYKELLKRRDAVAVLKGRKGNDILMYPKTLEESYAKTKE